MLSKNLTEQKSYSLSTALIVLGVLFLVAAVGYAAYSLLQNWLLSQNRYLVDHQIVPLSAPSPTPANETPTLGWIVPTIELKATHGPTVGPGNEPNSPTASGRSAMSLVGRPPSTGASATPSAPTPEAFYPPVKIRIPRIDVNRSIVALPRTRDSRSGALTWSTKRLFREGRQDLVGHSEGSALPGQQGNMILVGHNYGYGHNGVFVRLGRLKPGARVYVVDSVGQTFAYQVKTVERVKWRRQSLGELTRHLSLLSAGGPERLTLVSCIGAEVEPFPARIYVGAEPVEQ